MESGKNLLKDTIERAKYYKESYQPDIVIIQHWVAKESGSWRFLIQLRKLVWPWSYLNQIGDSTTNMSLSGTLAMYELRAGKVQLLTAHTGPIIAVAFSSDGKNLASYSVSDNKLHFWQTSTGMFGLGNAQTKCTRFVGHFES